MESRTKIFGHPIHPMLIVFPLGLFITAVIFDILYLITGNQLFPAVSYYNILVGIIVGAVAGLFGFIDFRAIPEGSRARQIGRLHGFGNLVVLLFFTMSWITRQNIPGYLPEWFSLAFSFLGVGLGALTAWLGGELVDRLGVGVDPGANVNAPSSLSGQPAAEPTRMRTAQVPVTGEDQNLADEP